MGKDDTKYDFDEEKFIITPWGCLYATLMDYGIDVRHVSGKVGEHIVDDFMETMVKAGYIGRSDGGD